MLTDDVFAEARAIMDPKNTSDCSGRRTNRASNNCADGAARLPTLFRAFLVPGNTPGLIVSRKAQRSEKA
jgi:hypothetical protein